MSWQERVETAHDAVMAGAAGFTIGMLMDAGAQAVFGTEGGIAAAAVAGGLTGAVGVMAVLTEGADEPAGRR